MIYKKMEAEVGENQMDMVMETFFKLPVFCVYDFENTSLEVSCK